jgi:hypothetical protein
VGRASARWFPNTLVTAFLLAAMPAVAAAQSRRSCRVPERPSIGVAVGKSSPYLELPRDAVPGDGPRSLSVGGGPVFGARADLSIAGPFRVRVEGSTGRWEVIGRTYDAERGFQLASEESLGSMSVRQVGAAIGLRTGRPPSCAYLLAGGGLHRIGFRGVTLRRPGMWLIAGMEAPLGPYGLLQLEAQLHIIDTADRPPAFTPTALAARLTAGWAYRF